MSRLSDSDDDPPEQTYSHNMNISSVLSDPIDQYGEPLRRPPKTKNMNFNIQRTLSQSSSGADNASLTEHSSEDEHKIPNKRPRYDSTHSSQSSSGEDGSASEHASDPESESEAPPSFANLQQTSVDSSDHQAKPRVGGIGERMMKSAGYVEGKGLGKYGQGRVDPIEASMQRGRTGLGFQSYSKGKAYQGPSFDPSMEKLTAEENPIWMDPSRDEILDRDLLESWMVIGPKKMTIDDEIEFCDPDILDDILSLKTALDSMSAEDLRRVRSQCNPFEKIGKVFFVNRAALKMANMDAVFDFMFTNPRDDSGHPLIGHNDLLYFADVCAGPGGFTEYVLWRKKWIAKGFGFTLKNQNDFKLSELHAASTETFTPYYGVAGDGDIFNPNNLDSLKKYVLANTLDKGVHFLMADGGFSVEGQENIQEILSKQLYLCQCIAALSLVREGGHFVVKLFDIFTEFSIGLIYLMYKSFQRVCLHKPNTSRPANSERYLICKGKRASSDSIERHLLHVNSILWSNKNRSEDVTHLVPLNVIKKDKRFYNYIIDSNNRIGIQQKVSLLKVIEFHKNPRTFEETRHTEMRMACLNLWKIPDQLRSSYNESGPHEALMSVLNLIKSVSHIHLNTKDDLLSVLKFKPRLVKNYNDLRDATTQKKFINSINDWKFVFLNNYSGETTDNKFHFYLGSHGNVYELHGKHWTSCHEIRLPAGTFILAERVYENIREGRGLRRTNGLHIIDAFCLGGVCVLQCPLEERFNRIALFCLAHNRPNDGSRIPLRCKKLYKLENLRTEIDKLDKRQLKNMDIANATSVPNVFDNNDLYFVTKSVLLIKDIKDPWTLAFSKTHSKMYYFDTSNNLSTYDFKKEAILDTFGALKTCIEWTNIDKDCKDSPMIKYLTNS